LKSRLIPLVLAATASLLSTVGQAQPIPGVRSDKEAMRTHMMNARAIAGWDLYAHYVHRCILDQTYRQTISRGFQTRNTIEPVKVMDNLYWLGAADVSAWALDTGAGIVLFDTMDRPDDVTTILIPQLRKVGLDPADIKYVVITHGHADHYGGADYIRQTYNARLLASPEDWAFMASQSSPYVPKRDMDIVDGQVWTVGNVTMTFYLTPGHTPGTVSTVFKTTDNGVPHTVGFFGGMGTPSSAADKNTLIQSAKRFEGIVKAAGADVQIANHMTQDQAIPKLEEIRYRHPTDPNPYVIGNEAFLRYLQVQEECTRVALAQQGQK
jgi:metallo-beta-lactamase class B